MKPKVGMKVKNVYSGETHRIVKLSPVKWWAQLSGLQGWVLLKGVFKPKRKKKK